MFVLLVYLQSLYGFIVVLMFFSTHVKTKSYINSFLAQLCILVRTAVFQMGESTKDRAQC